MERWPPVYDAEDLLNLINSVRDRNRYPQFYDLTVTAARRCQGDIIRMPSEIPIIDYDSKPALTDNVEEFWLIIGNTCDFERDLTDLRWTQIVPVVSIGNDNTVDDYTLGEAKAYRMSRHFYIPDWVVTEPVEHFMAELTTPVTVDKQAILASRVEARMSYSAWILLNACMMRFMARDDGRWLALS